VPQRLSDGEEVQIDLLSELRLRIRGGFRRRLWSRPPLEAHPEETMTDPHRLDEGLELLYTLRERGMSDVASFLRVCTEPHPDSLLREVLAAGLVTREADALSLTQTGMERAAGIIRRHRLAEVLMRSVLEVEEPEMEETACAFEHVLGEGAVDRVCAFLGHPTHCPHGRPIPPGQCCSMIAEAGESIQPLSEMQVGDLCEVVHIRPKHHARLDRLGAYGLVPRSVIRLHQKRPSFVVQIDETDLAIDIDVAKDIYVRIKV
jgi:DtxR family Mn-dependent transcriptional regulator